VIPRRLRPPTQRTSRTSNAKDQSDKYLCIRAPLSEFTPTTVPPCPKPSQAEPSLGICHTCTQVPPCSLCSQMPSGFDQFSVQGYQPDQQHCTWTHQG
ncbi:hypothetical protein NDU88_004583, partial [Pleurodeles waltl]